jgi:hypothetical protein
MPGPLAMLGIQAGLGVGQSILGNRAAKREQQRMDEQAAQDRLISSFGGNAQPQQRAAQQGPGVGQQVLADPLTKQLLAGLIGKIGGGGGGNPIFSSGGGGGAPGVGGFMNQMTQ